MVAKSALQWTKMYPRIWQNHWMANTASGCMLLMTKIQIWITLFYFKVPSFKKQTELRNPKTNIKEETLAHDFHTYQTGMHPSQSGSLHLIYSLFLIMILTYFIYLQYLCTLHHYTTACLWTVYSHSNRKHKAKINKTMIYITASLTSAEASFRKASGFQN